MADWQEDVFALPLDAHQPWAGYNIRTAPDNTCIIVTRSDLEKTGSFVHVDFGVNLDLSEPENRRAIADVLELRASVGFSRKALDG